MRIPTWDDVPRDALGKFVERTTREATKSTSPIVLGVAAAVVIGAGIYFWFKED